MKTLKVFLCLSLFTFHFSLTYGQSWDWGRAGYNGTLKTTSEGFPVATDKTGNAYITGQFDLSIIFGSTRLTGTSINAYLVKYNSSGTVIWANAMNDISGDSYGASVATDKSGNIFTSGYFSGHVKIDTFSLYAAPPTNTNVYIVKYASGGNVLWAKQSTLPSPTVYSLAEGLSVATDKFGNEFVAGIFQDSVFFGSYLLTTKYLGQDVFLVKYDSSGNVLWAVQSGLPSRNGYAEDECSVIADNLGNAYVAGSYSDSLSFGSTILSGSVSEFSGFLVKYSPAGNLLWAKQMVNNTHNSYCTVNAVTCDRANNPYIAGCFGDTVNFSSLTLYSNTSGSAFLTKYDTSGNAIWARGSSSGWSGTDLAADAYNHIYLAGLTANALFPDTLKFGSYSLNTTYYWTTNASFLVQFDTSGTPRCGSMLNDIGGYGDKPYSGVASDSTGTFVYTASLYEDTVFCGPDTLYQVGGDPDIFLGRWQSCSQEEGINELKVENGGLKVYPNPFRNSTTISVESGKYKVESYLELYDVTGQKLKSVEFTGNTYTLSAEGLAKGMYFIRVSNKDNNLIGTSKIVVQ